MNTPKFPVLFRVDISLSQGANGFVKGQCPVELVGPVAGGSINGRGQHLLYIEDLLDPDDVARRVVIDYFDADKGEQVGFYRYEIIMCDDGGKKALAEMTASYEMQREYVNTLSHAYKMSMYALRNNMHDAVVQRVFEQDWNAQDDD